MLLTENFSPIAVIPDTASVLIARDLSVLSTSATVTQIDELSVKVFPNPAQSKVIIQSEQILNEAQLIDINGRTWPVQLINTGSTQYRIQVDHIPRGLYALRLQSKLTYNSTIIRIHN